MQPGDIIAFSGKGQFSELIKWATRSSVSHIGIVFESKVVFSDKAQPGVIVDVFESTTLHVDPATGKRVAGVQRNRMSDHVKYYDGHIWWLPLSKDARSKLNTKKFTDFLLHQDDKEYDMPQAIASGVDILDAAAITKNREDFSKFFCSELAAAALESAGVIRSINASEVTPADLCSFALFESTYHLLKGGKRGINGFNSMSPEGFGE